MAPSADIGPEHLPCTPIPKLPEAAQMETVINQFVTPKNIHNVSQIDGPTPKNSFGFKISFQNIQDAKALHEYQYLTVLSMEIHAETRADLRPDPEFDAIRCIFYSVLNDVPGDKGQRKMTAVMIVDEESAKQTEMMRCSDPSSSSVCSTSSAGVVLKQTLLQKSGITSLNVTYYKTELELISNFVELVQSSAECLVTLNIYSFENCIFHILHQRVPQYSYRTLNDWFEYRTHLHRLITYRVESMMLRIAKPMNYIPVSPNIQQRSRMRAPECIQLNLEPESKLYTHPVVVLDFQSLEGSFEFGCTSLNIAPKLLKKLKDDVTVCPNGVVFVKQHIKKGVLPRMVEDILNTRLMTLQRLLHARQLGLKLISNVTFGYTSANYSGRMPCVEVGDSIVRKARETLERAIEMVENRPEWGARVVYGDTDRLDLVNDTVYLPCVLQTKKRYVGFMYEAPEQKDPIFDAKGIETVRRDNCMAVSKILEKSIKTLFVTRDITAVKRYVQRQCQKLMEGNVNIQDCVFAKEYRGMSGYRPGACVPALQIAKLSKDRRTEPRVRERVPYVIVYGTPGLPLIQLVREPQELLQDPSLRLNASYYVTKQILPPLDRLFSLLGGTISQYFTTLTCPVCEETTTQGTCQSCQSDPQRVAVVINSRIRNWQRTFYQLIRVCNNCMACPDPTLPCISLDCPILYRITKASRDYSQYPDLQKIQKRMLQF
ncbi:hypothetical protein LSH36_617g00013 [Paralvinella palmiformis]|uniref:DNA-directed DNA polymerase n=1 Tax=Paralvinella palmiformis TaxID=53620 RepID=A0AAD9J4M0_9ANNE|nr:hypothetical protein LSH36_617g00013 [Paralvinella palmiformis]